MSTILLSIHGLEIFHGMERLLLTRVRNLRHWRHFEVRGCTNATKVTIADCKNASVTPNGAIDTTWSLLANLHELIEMNPATTTWAFVAQNFVRHEEIRCLHANAYVRLVCSF